MKDQNKKKIRHLGIRLNEQEYEQIAKLFSQTSVASVSTYARKILLQKPVTFLVRNQSEDEMIAELTKLRSELNALGKNFNQAVKKLNAMRHVKEMEHWLVVFEIERRGIEKHVAKIESEIKKMAEKWLR